ncbi:tRNA synthetase class II core domain family protein [Mycobacterium xenopi 4042]|uniref:Histidyl-tRNA synthetase n=1 Tax=Mycobacterium xenopi 4042 TaxID=1299334 RepID=X8ANM1_MYCXE|nr:tRNA synthetase class II core domain family protein [Mycobacterium xenopi 4042]
MTQFSAPKGVPDYVPPESAGFVAVRDGLLDAARRAGYRDIELPIFEDTALFARGVGESTDVVSKEMYTFTDRGDRSVTLRPEGTAGVVRAVIEHGLDRGALPIKLCYAGPFFRYERPQAGRYRQLQQVGVEAIGVDDPALDAEVIAVADAGFVPWACGTSGWKSPRWATKPVGLSIESCCRTSCFSSTWMKKLAGAPKSTRCGCSTTSVPRSRR